MDYVALFRSKNRQSRLPRHPKLSALCRRKTAPSQSDLARHHQMNYDLLIGVALLDGKRPRARSVN
jgi:hypothetical protein